MTYKDTIKELKLRIPPEMKKDLKMLYKIEGFNSLNSYSVSIFKKHIESRRKILDTNYIKQLTVMNKLDWLIIALLYTILASTTIYLIIAFSSIGLGIDSTYIIPYFSVFFQITNFLFLGCIIIKLVFFNIINRNPEKVAKKISIKNKIVNPISIKPKDSYKTLSTEHGNLYLKCPRKKIEEIEYDQEKVAYIQLHPNLTYFTFVEI